MTFSKTILSSIWLFTAASGAWAEPSGPQQITDASFGFFSIPQIGVQLNPPAISNENVNDTGNLDLVMLCINPRNQRKVLALFGDSRMGMFSMEYRFPITVYGFARAASTSVGVVNRLANMKNITAINPHTKVSGIFIQVGVNDVLATNYSFYKTDFKENYRKIAAYLKENFPGVPVAIGDIVTLNSVQDRQRSFDYDTIDDYNKFLEVLCAEQGWTLFKFNPMFAAADRSLKKEYNFDGIHLTPAAHDIIYEKVMTYFAPVFDVTIGDAQSAR